MDGADEIRRAVRQAYKDGSDLVKIAATGGVLSLAKSGQAPLFTDEELRAVVETAKDYGLKVAAHAHGVQLLNRLLVEHGSP